MEMNTMPARLSVSKVLVLVIMTLCIKTYAQDSFYYNKYKHWSSELESLATNSSDAMALVCLGSCYDRGDGVTQDRKQAFELFRQAASLGDKLGLYNLALYYHRGYLVEQDDAYAIKLLNKAIEVDPKFIEAYIVIAQTYEAGGKGVDKDASKAFQEWKRLANIGHPRGQYTIAHCYENGLGVNRDLDNALYW